MSISYSSFYCAFQKLIIVNLYFSCSSATFYRLHFEGVQWFPYRLYSLPFFTLPSPVEYNGMEQNTSLVTRLVYLLEGSSTHHFLLIIHRCCRTIHSGKGQECGCNSQNVPTPSLLQVQLYNNTNNNNMGCLSRHVRE